MIVRETVSHVPHEEAPPHDEPSHDDPELQPLSQVLAPQGVQLEAQGAELQRLTR
jgi:hypothetical protein